MLSKFFTCLAFLKLSAFPPDSPVSRAQYWPFVPGDQNEDSGPLELTASAGTLGKARLGLAWGGSG